MRSRAGGGALHALLLQAARQLCSSTSALEVSQANKAAACLSPPSQASSSRAHAKRQTPFGNSCCSACHVLAEQRPYSGHSAAALHQRHQQQQPHVYHPSLPLGSSSRAAIREDSESAIPGWLSPHRQGTVMHCQSSEVQQDCGDRAPPSTEEQRVAAQDEEAEVRTPPRALNEMETSHRAPAEQWRLKLKLGRCKTLDSLLAVVGAYHEQFSPQTACHALIKLAALHRKQQQLQKEQQHHQQERSQQYRQGGGAARKTAKGVQLLAACLEVSSPGDFTARDISNAAYAIAKLSKGPRWAFMALVLAAGDIPPCEFNARDLDQLLWALGVAGVRAPRLLEALEPRAVELVPDLESFQLSNVLRAVFSQLQHPAPALYAAALEAAPASIPNMHAEALANLLLAFGDAPDILSASAGQQGIAGSDAAEQASHLPPWTVLELAERRALQLVQRTEPRRLSRRDLRRLLEGLSSVYAAAASGGKGSRAAERSTAILHGAVDNLHNGHGQVPPTDLKRIMAAILSASSSLARC